MSMLFDEIKALALDLGRLGIAAIFAASLLAAAATPAILAALPIPAGEFGGTAAFFWWLFTLVGTFSYLAFPGARPWMGRAVRLIYGAAWSVIFVAFLRPLWRWLDPVRGILELATLGIIVGGCLLMKAVWPAVGLIPLAVIAILHMPDENGRGPEPKDDLGYHIDESLRLWWDSLGRPRETPTRRGSRRMP